MERNYFESIKQGFQKLITGVDHAIYDLMNGGNNLYFASDAYGLPEANDGRTGFGIDDLVVNHGFKGKKEKKQMKYRLHQKKKNKKDNNPNANNGKKKKR